MLSVMSIIEGGERELSLLSYGVCKVTIACGSAAAKAANANGDRLCAYGHMVQRRTAALTQGVVFSLLCFVCAVFDLCCFKTVGSFAAFYRSFSPRSPLLLF